MPKHKAVPFTLTALPYAQNALAPIISANTVSYHYGKHHQGYVDRLNELVLGTGYEEMDLEELINTAEYINKGESSLGSGCVGARVLFRLSESAK